MYRSTAELPSALANAHLRRRLAGRQVAIFCDYDGTLTPIVARPELAHLDPATRAVLERLAGRCVVAIISGRDLADVMSMVATDGVWYAGSHGFDLCGPGGVRDERDEGLQSLDQLADAATELEQAALEISGAWVERKRFAVAIHFREVDDGRLRDVEAAVDRTREAHPGLRRSGGKQIFELRPDVEWDKGRALWWVFGRAGLRADRTVPIYLGDDVTDEDAYAALGNRGIAIVVDEGDRPTHADYRLENPRDVREFLIELAGWLESPRAMSDWLFVYEGFDPDEEGHREALCVLGNGYFATRGAVPECVADGVHYPGTYIAGVYNRLVTRIAGHDVPNESLVNVPNWLPLTFRAGGGPWFGEAPTEVLAHHVELDMFRGILTRRSRLRDPEGHVVQVTQRRLVSVRDPHLAGLETTLVAENFSGRLEVHSALDGTVCNSGVERYASLANRHLAVLRTDRVGDEIICLDAQTTQSHVQIAEASARRVYRDGRRLSAEPELVEREGYIASQYTFDVEAGQETTVEKIVTIFTSHDTGISEPGEEARSLLTHVAGDFDELLRRHAMSWRQLWARTRIELGTDGSLARVAHLHLFHLLQTVSNNTLGLDVGVPARGLHGEAYRGHIFWDELFILPFLSLRFPELTKALLLYRYRRLDQARLGAADTGFTGAMFPWQSTSSGREETQTTHLNPVSGRWVADASHLQRHVNTAIVHNTWRYYQATRDGEFLRLFGAELILEIACFWASGSTYDHALDRYEIKGVMGPDEYHDGYPDRDEPGLDNNAYTNVMAVWCLRRAFDTLDALPTDASQELKARLEITDDDLDRWTDIARKMRVCFHDGVISQFEGYELLAELDWDVYRDRAGDISRLDRILESEGDSPNRYQLAKQADVAMLFYLLAPDELTELFSDLGYECDRAMMQRTIAYYEARTAHGSTLSRVVHSWIHARHDRTASWHLLVEALYSDVDDIQTSTTKEGIHLGAMAGTIDLIQRCYTGIEARHDMLAFDPAIPEELGSLAFDVHYQGHLVHLEFTTTSARVRVDLDKGEPITIAIRDDVRVVTPGDTVEVELDGRRDG